MDNDKYIGRLLDNRYEILEVIGSGGMAVVYKARCHRLNRLVAIKILRDDYLEDEDFRRRFHAESQAVAMFSHPNIVSVYDVSTSVSLEADYIVMELIDGISLKQYMEKKGILNWKETLHFAMQIAKALEHAHSRGIVHRDIKPHNIMVLKNGSVKVADFGIARLMSQGNTLTKEALGSVHYISPEQAKGGRVDTRSDVYSLGVVMYEMMTGRPPYDGDSPVSVAIKHIEGGAPMPSTLNPSIPDGLEQIIMKAMANNIDDRYDSISQMLTDMDEFRKDPTMLFGYSAAALEALIQFPPKTPATPPAGTVAERTASRVSGQRQGQKPPQRRTSQSASTKRRAAEAKSDKISTVAIIICCLLVVSGIAIILWLGLANPTGKTSHDVPLVVVPDWSGKDHKKIQNNEGFELIREYEYSDTVEEGKVIRTEPGAGEKIGKGAKLVVVISSGRQKTMLNLLLLTEADATQRLEDLGIQLKVQVVPTNSTEVAVGKVISTEPAAGELLNQGQTIKLHVSIGSADNTMPNLEETEKDVAIEMLEKKNLNLDVVEELIYHSTIPAGQVVSTDPVKGSELAVGDKVTLYISQGPELGVVPPLEGRMLEDALITLWDAGFKVEPIIVEVNSPEPEGKVLKQSVPARQEADVNQPIVLEVSVGLVEKDVTIPIEVAENCEVVVKCDGAEVLKQTVTPEDTEIVIPSQKGLGSVVYEVYIDNVLTKSHTEEF